MTILTGLDLPAGSPGGSVELLRDLYLAPDRLLDADVFMLAGPTGRVDVTVTQLGVEGKQLDGEGFWRYVDGLARAIADRFRPEDYGILHLQHLAFGASPALLRAFPRHRSIALVHGTDLLLAADSRTQRQVLVSATGRAAAVVVPTLAMADLLRAASGSGRARITHIPWGIPDHLLSAPPPRAERADDTIRLLYAGRLTPEKGVDDLLAALAGLEDAILSVAAPVSEYRALGARRDLSPVRYLGWLSRHDLWRSFADHDVLVVPSARLEAFGLVAVEAQACGIPVLYQPVAGLAEVLGDSALAVDMGGLADAVRRLAKDYSLLDELREAGYRNAARFPLSRTASELRAMSAQMEA
jgi:glycosyltransferase involved in cell wall biosynthesis